MRSFRLQFVLFGLALSASLISADATANDNGMRPSIFTALEKPLAFQVGDVTVQIRGSLEQSLNYDLKADEGAPQSEGTLTFSAETQTDNQLTVGAEYSPTYGTHVKNIANVGGGQKDEKLTHKGMVYVSGVWGKVSGGSVNSTVEDNTLRRKPAGKAALAFDGNLGKLNKWGGAYSGRFGPVVVSAAVDDEAHFDIGLRMSRPIGDKDIGLALRGSTGTFTSHDNSTTYDTMGVSAVADVIYGSTMLDLRVGYEVLEADHGTAPRIYGGLGVAHKTGALTVSAHGHYGMLDGEVEKSAALGASYDFARGLSANVGLNYARLNATNVDGVNLADKDELEAVASVKFEF